jgi:hypothetical protein
MLALSSVTIETISKIKVVTVIKSSSGGLIERILGSGSQKEKKFSASYLSRLIWICRPCWRYKLRTDFYLPLCASPSLRIYQISLCLVLFSCLLAHYFLGHNN